MQRTHDRAHSMVFVLDLPSGHAVWKESDQAVSCRFWNMPLQPVLMLALLAH